MELCAARFGCGIAICLLDFSLWRLHGIADSRSALCPATVAAVSGICRDRCTGALAWDWGGDGRIQRDRCGVAAAAAVREPGAAGVPVYDGEGRRVGPLVLPDLSG